MMKLKSITTFMFFLMSFQEAFADQLSHDQSCLLKAIYEVQRTTDFLLFALDQELLSERKALSVADVENAMPADQSWSSEQKAHSNWTGESRFLKLTLIPDNHVPGLPSEFPYALKFEFGDDAVLSEIGYQYKKCNPSEGMNITDSKNLPASDVNLLSEYKNWLEKSQLVQNLAINCKCITQKRTKELATFPAYDNPPKIEGISLNLYQQTVAVSIKLLPGSGRQLLITSKFSDDNFWGFKPIGHFSADNLNMRLKPDDTVRYFLPYHER